MRSMICGKVEFRQRTAFQQKVPSAEDVVILIHAEGDTLDWPVPDGNAGDLVCQSGRGLLRRKNSASKMNCPDVQRVKEGGSKKPDLRCNVCRLKAIELAREPALSEKPQALMSRSLYSFGHSNRKSSKRYAVDCILSNGIEAVIGSIF